MLHILETANKLTIETHSKLRPEITWNFGLNPSFRRRKNGAYNLRYFSRL